MSEAVATSTSKSGHQVMDKQWEKIQQKAFTKWVGSHLKKKGATIENIQEDFKTGLLLITFLEAISGTPVTGKFEKKPRMRIQSIQNVDQCLKFIASQGVKLISIQAENIVDGDLTLILGMVWTIIQRWAIADISEEELSAKEALLLWCQKKTAGYANVGVTNFTTSWMDGLALCALIHRHRPDLLDFNSLDKDDHAGNLQLAFDIAEDKLGITKLLDVEDMTPKPDERSVITYVAAYYHKFAAGQKAEVAARRVGRLVDLTDANDLLKNKYIENATELAAWIAATTEAMGSRDFGNSIEELQQKIDEHQAYKANVKPPKAADKLSLEGLFSNLQLKLSSNNRPAFVPPEGLSTADIHALWEALAAAERAREEAMRLAVGRQQNVDVLKRRLNDKAARLEAWIARSRHYLAHPEHVDSVNVAAAKLKELSAFDDEYAGKKSALDQVLSVAAEIQALNTPDAADAKQRADKLAADYAALAPEAAKKKVDLEAKLAEQQRIEKLRLEFASRAKEYVRWCHVTCGAVAEDTFGETLETVQNYVAQLDSSDADFHSTSDAMRRVVDAVWDELVALGARPERYTMLTDVDIKAAHDSVLAATAQRRVDYDGELKRQLAMEQQRKLFAEQAQAFVEHLDARRADIDAQVRGEASPTVLSEALGATYDGGRPEADGLEGLRRLAAEMVAAGIKDNKHTPFDVRILTHKADKFGIYVRSQQALLAEEASMKESYLSRAAATRAWIESAEPAQADLNFGANTLADAQELQNRQTAYKTGPRAEKHIAWRAAEALYKNINKHLASASRPAFEPPADATVAALQARWAELEAHEKRRDTALKAYLARLERLEQLVKRFQSDRGDLEAWLAQKNAYLAARETIDTLDQAQFNVMLFDLWEDEKVGRLPRVEALRALVDEIASLDYHDLATITSAADAVFAAIAALDGSSASKQAYLAEQLAEQQRREDLRVSFAEHARDFANFVKQTVDTISDYSFGFTLRAVRDHKAELDASDSQLDEAICKRQDAIAAISAELKSSGVTDNVHTTYTQADVEAQVASLSEALQRRQEAYSAELQKQELWEQKREHFAGEAAAFIDWLAQQRQLIEGVTSSVPDEGRAAVNDIFQGGEPGKAKLAAVTALGQDMEQVGIFDNDHTNYTVPILRARLAQFETFVKGRLQGFDEERELAAQTQTWEAENRESDRREALLVDYSRDAKVFGAWCETADDSLNEPIVAQTIAAVEALKREHDLFVGTLPAQGAAFQSLVAQAGELKALSLPEPQPLEGVASQWEGTQTASRSRADDLAAALETQNANDALCRDFAGKAQAFQTWLEEQSQRVAGAAGTLEEQLKSLQLSAQEIGSVDLLAAASAVADRLMAAGVGHNPHSNLTVQGLKVQHQQLATNVEAKLKLVHSEILSKQAADIKPEQLSEFQEVFNHFDKNKDNSLALFELKACLHSLGDDLDDAQVAALAQQHGGGSSGVSFEIFSKIMVQRTKDSDSKEEILASFRALSEDKDFITEADIRRVMNAERATYLLAKMPAYPGVDNAYDYVSWAEAVFQR